MQFEPERMERREVYYLLTSAVVPRPIAFVSTRGKDGSLNLAPFSYFNAFSSDPPMIMFGPGRKRDGSPKDTLRNVEETGEFVVNVVVDGLEDAITLAAQVFDYGVSEFEKVGLTPVPSVKVKPPRVRETPVSMECKLVEVWRRHPGARYSIVIGEVVLFHVADEVLAGGVIDPYKLKPVGRLGGDLYSRTHEIFVRKRLDR
ncbi:MAG: flavin reductase family protein [Nitrospinota bacterium]